MHAHSGKIRSYEVGDDVFITFKYVFPMAELLEELGHTVNAEGKTISPDIPGAIDIEVGMRSNKTVRATEGEYICIKMFKNSDKFVSVFSPTAFEEVFGSLPIADEVNYSVGKREVSVED